jgi:hypothetical protein
MPMSGLIPAPRFARGHPQLIGSLGLSLPYEVTHADLWMACTVAYRR